MRVLRCLFLIAALHVLGCRSTVSTQSAKFNPYAGPKPIAVLVERDPWLQVIGADEPRVAVYEDGTVIYCDTSVTSRVVHRTYKLSPAEFARLAEDLGPSRAFRDLGHFYMLRDATDQITYEVFLTDGRRSHAVSVYGADPADGELQPSASSASEVDEHIVPPEFNRVYRVLTGLGSAQAREWVSDYMEVCIWPYDAEGEPKPWPTGWPTLGSPTTRRSTDTCCVLFMPGRQFSELRAFLSTVAERQAVLIDGRKWSTYVRFAFPNEPLWRRAFNKTQDAEASENFPNPKYSAEAVRKLEQEFADREAAELRAVQKRSQALIQRTPALMQFAEVFDFTNGVFDGYWDGQALTDSWSATVTPKKALPFDCRAHVTFLMGSNETVAASLTPQQVLGCLEDICSTPFVGRIMDKYRHSEILLRAAGIRLHYNTRDVEQCRAALAKRGAASVPLEEWIDFQIYLGPTHDDFVAFLHPLNTDVYVVTLGFEHVAEWRKKCRRIDPEFVTWFDEHWLYMGPDYPTLDRNGNLTFPAKGK